MAIDLSALDAGLALEAPGWCTGTPARAALNAFEEDPDNPRFEDDPVAFDAFVADVAERGILQPIVVRRTSLGLLRIRFGARRYRAAKRLGLADVPYVVTEDERQFDDYAQVAENEQRASLQPLELAAFIAKKLGQGEQKKQVAARLRIDASAVTHLLALSGAVPPFILELYHTRKCRAPSYLYELRRLWAQTGDLVERWCRDAGSIDRHWLDALAAEVRVVMGPRKGGGTEGALVSAASQERETDKPEHRHGETSFSRTIGIPPSTASTSMSTPLARTSQLCHPQLLGLYNGYEVMLDLHLFPSAPDRIYVRHCAGGHVEDVAISAISLTRLSEMAE